MIGRIAIAWEVSGVSGWGVFGLNLVLGLAKRGRPEPLLLTEPNLLGMEPGLKHKLAPLMAKQVALPPMLEDTLILDSLRGGLEGSEPAGRHGGKERAGVVFLEDTRLDEKAKARAGALRQVFAGSSWNAEVLRANGIDNVTVLLQGVDTARFRPKDPTGRLTDRFVIFSGGKLEFRKGQDIVITAFKKFQARHPEALLLTAWNNLWPEAAAGLTEGGLVDGGPETDSQGNLLIEPWLAQCGLPEGSFSDLGLVPNAHMPEVLREADAALFPNRCEGGTNLVAMESMACGLPVILSANTGHLDLMGEGNCYPLVTQSPVPGAGREGWGESEIEEVVEALESIYGDRANAARRGQAAAAFMESLTWDHTLDTLLSSIKDW